MATFFSCSKKSRFFLNTIDHDGIGGQGKRTPQVLVGGVQKSSALGGLGAMLGLSDECVAPNTKNRWIIPELRVLFDPGIDELDRLRIGAGSAKTNGHLTQLPFGYSAFGVSR